MLNIKHTANTVVGNAFIRGVSGGERKRVSIAEQFCSGAALSSWDNSTRGLDASTALDYAKSLRLLTDIMQQTTFVSLYQAGEGIYQVTDKVLLLNEGHVVYFGPSKDARAYMVGLGFLDLPRQTTADYLSGCTDPNERRYQEGRDESNVPSTPEAMEEAYRKSDIYARMMAEKDEYKLQMQAEERNREQFRAAVLDQKHRGVGKKSPYTVSFFAQIAAITQRQTILKFQNKFDVSITHSVVSKALRTRSGLANTAGNKGLCASDTVTDVRLSPAMLRPSSLLSSSAPSTSGSQRLPVARSPAAVLSSLVFSSTLLPRSPSSPAR